MSEATPEPVEHPGDMLPHETETPTGFPADLPDVPYGDEPEPEVEYL